MASAFGLLLVSGNNHVKKRRQKIYGSKSPPSYLLKNFVEKTVYLRCAPNTDPYPPLLFPDNQAPTDWYVVKVSNKDHIKKKHTTPNPVIAIKPASKKTPSLWSSRCLALGSTVYSIGGSLDDHQQQYCGNVYATEDANCSRWKQIAPMSTKRALCAEAVAVGGKIYVFFGRVEDNTGVSADGGGPVGEVFDPSKNTWEPISQPPVRINGDGRGPFASIFAVADESSSDGSKRIILGFPLYFGVLLAYDVTCDSWEILDSNFGNQYLLCYSNNSRPLLIGNTLYWIWVNKYGHGGLTAYDLNLKMWREGSIEHLNDSFYGTSHGVDKPIFFHFYGDLFYLIWHYSIDPQLGPSSLSMIRCARIRISKKVDKEKQKFRVKACAVSTTKGYLADRLMGCIDSVVL